MHNHLKFVSCAEKAKLLSGLARQFESHLQLDKSVSFKVARDPVDVADKPPSCPQSEELCKYQTNGNRMSLAIDPHMLNTRFA
eukprot:CAMPEP_0114285808 /NCGR_PEP_ID=MMETSP0059-20121206/5404_1 /TAXON_ID=36894 /ORGANISM="Pyramimonas parkeae, Strain CCMP726" /LENGTH=82 /DNA_ID=CAMNT_0001406771 /DNA_START=554 /DNA_END=799 /DNA_ORIENTATION=+